jgi:hypothetical protein
MVEIEHKIELDEAANIYGYSILRIAFNYATSLESFDFVLRFYTVFIGKTLLIMHTSPITNTGCRFTLIYFKELGIYPFFM